MSPPKVPPPTPTPSYQHLAIITDQVAAAFTAAAKATQHHQHRNPGDYHDTPQRSDTHIVRQYQHIEDNASPVLDTLLPTEYEGSNHVSYLQTPLTPLPATSPPLMSRLTASGRYHNPIRTPVHIFQRYFVVNRCDDIYPITRIHTPHQYRVQMPAPPEQQQESFLHQLSTEYYVDKHFEQPITYTLRNTDTPLLEIVITGIEDVWDICNVTLFADIQPGISLGKVHTFMSVVGNLLFAFVPNSQVLIGVPRMHMEAVNINRNWEPGTDQFGEYQFNVPNSDTVVGNVVIQRHFFDVGLKHCTKEEALIWLALLIAAELETKTPLVSFVPS